MTDRPLTRQARIIRAQSMGRRTAPASPAYNAGSLPLGFQTRVRPEDVLLHVSVPGEPIPKGRPRMTRATIGEHGELRQGHAYTPARTRQAEDEWRWIMKAARTAAGPTPAPVGALVLFRTRYGRADGDNLWKLVADAMNGTVIADDQQITEAHIHLTRHCTEPGTDLLVWLTHRRRPGE